MGGNQSSNNPLLANSMSGSNNALSSQEDWSRFFEDLSRPQSNINDKYVEKNKEVIITQLTHSIR